jgi:ribulose kinase
MDGQARVSSRLDDGHQRRCDPRNDQPKLLNHLNRVADPPLLFVIHQLEMEIPKTLWLKTHMKPELFARCNFFDLPDYRKFMVTRSRFLTPSGSRLTPRFPLSSCVTVTFRATSSPARSSNSLVCKFSYIPPDAVTPPSPGWNPDFLTKIGLGELVDRGLGALGGVTGEKVSSTENQYLGEGQEALVMTAGLPVGKGLSARAAKELGLTEGTSVGSGVIDACKSASSFSPELSFLVLMRSFVIYPFLPRRRMDWDRCRSLNCRGRPQSGGDPANDEALHPRRLW